MKLASLLSVLALCGTVVVVSCSKSTTEDISAVDNTPKDTPDDDTDTPSDTTTVAKITYKSHVRSIMEAKCVSCHGSSSPSAGISLSTYAEVKQSAQSGTLIAVMNGADPVMPPSGTLPQNTLDLIDQWKKDGFLEK